MIQIILKLVGTIILAVSVLMIYDARTITVKVFSNTQVNETTKMIKIIGFIISLIGIAMIYFS